MKLANINYKMPPEWELHQRTFIGWPVKESVCWPENYEELCKSFAKVANQIAQFEPVTMLVNRESVAKATELCGHDIDILELEHNDSWLRDNGPTFVRNDKGELAGVNWIFNAWGEKYSPWDLDNEVAPKLLKQLNIPCINSPFILEGGSIHVDGQGTLLTTEECLLNKKRNPHLSKGEIEELLKLHLGVEKVIWLKKGLDGDETDGHVDNVACFAKPGVVIMQVCSNPNDPNYQITKENIEILENCIDAKGRKIKVITIEQPPITYYNGARLTLSYLNFYFVNNGIILPVFGEKFKEYDQKAKEVLEGIFPERKVVPVDGMCIVKEGGNVHCITQQMPLGDSGKQ